MPFTIGLIGHKNSGKSTVATYLLQKYKGVEFAFAEPIKKMCVDIFKIPEECVNGTQAEKEAIIPELAVSGRQLMQVIGTDLFRDTLSKSLPQLKLGPSGSIWVNILEQNLLYHIKYCRMNNYITDIRFMNEAEMVKRVGGKLIRIIRPVLLEKEFLATSLHSSETSLDNMREEKLGECFTIVNDSTLEKLYADVDEIVKRIREDNNKPD